MNFTVEGRPVPAARMTRRQVQTGLITQQAKRYLAYKDTVGWTARAKGIVRLGGNIRIEIKVYLHGNKDGDLDNYCKSLIDSLNGIAYEDDKQVIELHAFKFKVDTVLEQRAEISIEGVE